MIRVSLALFLWLVCLLGLSSLGACGVTRAQPQEGLLRSVWVTRYEYRTAADIRRVINNCADLGFTTVFFQVRGNGTVYYRSEIEAWTEVHGFADPGFDPLATAVEVAHARGVQLHAWINTVPGWRGDVRRAAPKQLVRIRPAWFLRRGDDDPVALGEGYYWLNPCLPEVRRYLTSLCEEIVTKYDVDGLHLDHIRLSDLDGRDQTAIPGDRRSIELFRQASGQLPVDDPAAFERWRAACVTQLVREIAVAVRSEGSAVLSVAVIADPKVARVRYDQDWEAWARERLVDVIVPMNYDDDDTRFQEKLEAGLLSAQGVDVVEGVAMYKHKTSEQTIRQMDLALEAGASGVALFSYSQLFKSGDVAVTRRRMDIGRALKRSSR